MLTYTDPAVALAASNIKFSPSGSVVATTAQTAIQEVDSKKLARSDNLSDLASASSSRTNLGLGSISTQSAGGVTITGGSISGTDLNTSLNNHTGATTNVHGLPANVAPLGHRAGSGRYVQEGAGTASGSLATLNLTSYRGIPVVFPVAFTSTPKVMVSGPFPVAVQAISTTGCTLFVWGDTNLAANNVLNYLAIGT